MNIYNIKSMFIRRTFMVFVVPLAYVFLIAIALFYTIKAAPRVFIRHLYECTYGLKALIINAWKYKEGQENE